MLFNNYEIEEIKDMNNDELFIQISDNWSGCPVTRKDFEDLVEKGIEFLRSVTMSLGDYTTREVRLYLVCDKEIVVTIWDYECDAYPECVASFKVSSTRR